MDVFVDESGFTGNHLLDAQQPFVAYVAVCGTSKQFDEQLASVRQRFRLNGEELKAVNLLHRSNGREAIAELIGANQNAISFFISDKRFALACNIFEYIFEPPLSVASSIFYEADFHLFIANLLYIVFRAADLSAEQIFNNFEKAMISKASAELDVLIPPSTAQIDMVNEPIGLIRTFALCHKDKIEREILSLNESSCGRWVLDLSLMLITVSNCPVLSSLNVVQM